MAKKLMQAEEITIQLPEMKLAGLRWGDSQQPAIVALHGWLDNAASFSPLAPLLEGYQVIALDMAGHGHSQHLATGREYRLADVAAYVVQALDRLQLDAVILLGHSLGGVIASYIAANFPARVQRLIMIDALGPLSHETMVVPGRLQKSIQLFLAAEERQPKDYPTIATMLKLRANINKISEQQLQPLVERGVIKTAKGYRWRFDPKLRLPSMSYFTEAEVLAMLANILTPTLVIEASEGVLANMEFVKARKAALKNITIEKLVGSHHLHLANPQQVATVILRFLDSLN